MHDVIIIGAGPAGLTAAMYTCRAGLKTAVVEGVVAGGQLGNTNIIENYPGFPEGIPGSELAMLMQQQATRFGAEIISEQIQDVELGGEVKRLTTKGRQLEAKAIIVAAGGSPRELGVPGEKELRGRGVSYCATCDGFFFRGKDVAVVGGGDTALEDALFLANVANKVFLIHRRDEYRGAKILQKRIGEKDNIVPVLNAVGEGIDGEDSVQAIRVKNVKDGSLSRLEVQGVFIAVGTLPNTQPFKGKLGMNEAGQIQTDAYMHTSVAGVYAAGDCRVTPLRQVVTACSDGAIAAYEAEKYILG